MLTRHLVAQFVYADDESANAPVIAVPSAAMLAEVPRELMGDCVAACCNWMRMRWRS